MKTLASWLFIYVILLIATIAFLSLSQPEQPTEKTTFEAPDGWCFVRSFESWDEVHIHVTGHGDYWAVQKERSNEVLLFWKCP